MAVYLVFRVSELKIHSLDDIRHSEFTIDTLRLDFQVSTHCKNWILNNLWGEGVQEKEKTAPTKEGRTTEK